MADELEGGAAHAPAGKGIKASLTKRVGPLPVWGWATIAIGGGIAFILLNRRAGSSGASSGGTLSDGTLYASGGSGAGSGGGGGIPVSGPLGGGWYGTPTPVVNNPAWHPGDPNYDWWNNPQIGPSNPVLHPGVGGSDSGGMLKMVNGVLHYFGPLKPGLPAWMEYPATGLPFWLIGNSAYPGYVATGAPPGYRIKAQYIKSPSNPNPPSYDPADPNVYEPIPTAGASMAGGIDTTMGQGSTNAANTEVGVPSSQRSRFGTGDYLQQAETIRGVPPPGDAHTQAA